MEIKIKVKPLSVNEAWMGRRFKTSKYEDYEKLVIWSLPPITLPSPPYHVTYTFGLSNILSDIDNPIKPFQDCLQKKYRFNDKDIHSITAVKVKVKKGEEFIGFTISEFK